MTKLFLQKIITILLMVVFCATGSFAGGETVGMPNRVKPAIAKDYPPAEKVDPFIGTGAHGHTYPGVCLPFGMVQLSPDTYNRDWDWCSGYHDGDTSIMGFSHTHLSGTGCADYGDFLFMPTTGPLKFKPGSRKNPDEGYRSRFSHDQETAIPGFYRVYLQDYDIDVQLTATKRVGVHKYTYPATREANIIIDIAHFIGWTDIHDSSVEIVGDREVRGHIHKSGWSPNRHLYFVARFSRPFEQCGLVVDGAVDDSRKQAEGKNLQCFVRFDASENRDVIVKVALSAVDGDGAAKNIDAECPGWDFQQVCKNAMQNWQKQLSKITIDGGSAVNQTIFYTALYHACLAPNLFVDVDGRYRGMDKKIHQAENFENYTVFSLWDTFRAAHPLFTIIEQQRTNDFINSFLGKYEQGGLLPYWELASGETWCMIGYHAVPVIVDAWIKGIRGYDVNEAYLAMKKSAMQDHQGLDEYKRQGYISTAKESQSASRTVEYAYDDWCIAVMAKGLGLENDYETFNRRSQQYRNLFDRSVGFIRGKDADGSWKPDFNPDDLTADGAWEFTEGNSWHYTWFAPHDVEGLIELMGGDQAFIRKLDELFTRQGREHADVSGLIGQYAHGNEPSHNFVYLYAYAGAPWKTQERVAQIVKTLYTDRPDGLCGNEDCGQMSAWYVFSAMGFYPVCPGQPIYVFGTPLFPDVRINLETGKVFHIVAEDVSDENIYIQSATLNNEPYTKSYILHADIINGGELVFKMGPAPNKVWGLDKTDRPHSAPGKRLTLMPYLSNPERFFTDTLRIDLRCDDDGAEIFYTLDGSEPNPSAKRYTGVFEVNATTLIKAKAYKEGCFPSNIFSTTATKLTLKPSLEVRPIENGLDYNLYVGDFRKIADFSGSEPQQRGQCGNFDLSVAKRGEEFGLEFSGYFLATKDGIYQFWTNSDDGSRLFIDSQLVVDNDGLHSNRFISGIVALEQGYHKIKALYFECHGDELLEVFVKQPGEQRKQISGESLFRRQ